jgi:hypothetical protein
MLQVQPTNGVIKIRVADRAGKEAQTARETRLRLQFSQSAIKTKVVGLNQNGSIHLSPL